MKTGIPKKLREKIDFIKKTEKPYGILLVGSSRKILEVPDVANSDIDIFVIKENGSFEREVFYEEETEFDISYISLEDLKNAVNIELHSIISVLSKAETVEMSPEAEKLIADIVEIYSRGPSEKGEETVRYGRFRLTKSLETVEKRAGTAEFDFFVHNYLKELLIFYFEIKGEWVPSEKKLIKSIEDQKLRDYVNMLCKTGEHELKIKSLKNMTDYIMEPVGGRLDSWEKSEYPFDFK